MKKPLELISENIEISNDEQKLSNKFQVRAKCFSDFDIFFADFSNEVCRMRMKKRDMDTIFVLCEKLVENQKLLYNLLIDQCGEKNAMTESTEYVCQMLKRKQTTYRRLQELKTNPLFVEPIERVIGVQWKTNISPEQPIPDHQLNQTTFQFVSIMDTLKSLFTRSDFKKVYFEYNATRHKCVPGVYRNFCCGSKYNNCDLLQDPNAIQIELAVDDFEVVSPLKSKTGKHKMNAIYFQIRNTPPEFNSKLNSINLVSLCNAKHFNHGGGSIDDIVKLIIRI